MKNIRIALVVFHSRTGETRQNLDRMQKWITAAKAENADMICFPEMNITGYGISSDMKDVAEPVPGPVTDMLLQLASEHHMTILAGLAEKGKNGQIFASHLVVSPDHFEVYRKLHIAPPERSIFSAGNDIPLFDIQGVKFGIQLCYDAHFPELSTYMAVNGAEVLFIPHASPRGTPEEKYSSWMRHLPARAYDNSIFVVACNQTGENENGLFFPGVSVVFDPSGNVMEKDLSGSEGMMITELKSEALERVRNHRMRFFLPNRRQELY